MLSEKLLPNFNYSLDKVRLIIHFIYFFILYNKEKMCIYLVCYKKVLIYIEYFMYDCVVRRRNKHN